MVCGLVGSRFEFVDVVVYAVLILVCGGMLLLYLKILIAGL